MRFKKNVLRKPIHPMTKVTGWIGIIKNLFCNYLIISLAFCKNSCRIKACFKDALKKQKGEVHHDQV